MIKKLASKVVYQNKWMKVREDTIAFQNGTEGIYGVVEKTNFALVVPFSDEKFYLVKQYRYPAQKTYWEFPQGAAEENPTISPEKLAKQELKEETGLVAGSMKSLGFFYEAYGFCSQGFTVFLAEQLTQESQQLEAAEDGLEVGVFSISEFEKLILDGQIKDGPSISAYGLLKLQKII